MTTKSGTLIATILLFPVVTASIATAQTTTHSSTGEINYLQVAVDYANCMLRYGRDRYGPVKSPLFANLLTRGKEPELPPYPLFKEQPRDYRDKLEEQERLARRDREPWNPFVRFDFNEVLNYPREFCGEGGAFAAEGPHKATIYGCDIFEDAALYQFLIDLSEMTCDPKYREAAEEAILWWFENTQHPESGLYPWGEHLGWDLVHDCPTYFEGPSRHLYAASFHEIKGDVPFLDYLAKLPPESGQSYRPIERYAFGIWNAHFWDKERCIFDRHGDYAAVDTREGQTAGFPAHLGAYLQIWSKAITTTTNPRFEASMVEIFHKVADMAIRRTKEHGVFPFTFSDTEGKKPELESGGQAERLASDARSIAKDLEAIDASLAEKLELLAELHPGPPQDDDGAYYRETKTDKYISSENIHRVTWGLNRSLEGNRRFGGEMYVKSAERLARAGYEKFCDSNSPLPRPTSGSEDYETAEGDPFPPFYWGGAGLMHGFARLGVIKGQTATTNRN
ncbi:MAG: hypothetical protein P1U87_18765 [Verrucomicrobiales bacterium]|nr:hypothetical protein [Verrucomicrobiales bacterium]